VRLAPFEFAAGKFPEAAVALMRRALANQVSVVALDDGGEDTRQPLGDVTHVLGHPFPREETARLLELEHPPHGGQLS
jgi:hypothetical protein